MEAIHETLKYILSTQLTRRYQDIVTHIPGMILKNGPKTKDTEDGVLLAYIDLCNEELLLHKAGQIPGPVWDSWKSGILAGNSLLAIKKAWCKMAKSDHYRELADFLKENGVDVFEADPLSD
jgi:hypothetical protein